MHVAQQGGKDPVGGSLNLELGTKLDVGSVKGRAKSGVVVQESNPLVDSSREGCSREGEGRVAGEGLLARRVLVSAGEVKVVPGKVDSGLGDPLSSPSGARGLKGSQLGLGVEGVSLSSSVPSPVL